MTDQRDAEQAAFDRSRAHRRGVRQACVDLEEALARPAGSGGPEGSAWGAETAARVDQLQAAFRYHVEQSEGPNGLLPEIMEIAPRLANAVHHLEAEHAGLLERIERVRVLAERAGTGGPVGEVREAALALLSDLAGHRHRGAELIYEAYSVDVEGGDSG